MFLRICVCCVDIQSSDSCGYNKLLWNFSGTGSGSDSESASENSDGSENSGSEGKSGSGSSDSHSSNEETTTPRQAKSEPVLSPMDTDSQDSSAKKRRGRPKKQDITQLKEVSFSSLFY